MKAPAPSFSWNVGALPFVWGPLAAPTNAHGLPTSLPFALEISPETGALVQSPNERVSGALSRAYSEGSLMVGLMDEEGIGREYAEDFLRFLTSHLPGGVLSGIRVLEIGCGTGYLLHRLRLLGADVWGVEPGAHGQAGARKYELPVVRDFFPSNEIRGTFDLVIMYAVLEHLEQPLRLLRSLAGIIHPRSRVTLAVPNCEPYLGMGDLSILLHEHWSYFTKETLKVTLACSGAADIRVEESGFGGALYAIAKAGRSERGVELPYVRQQAKQAQRYRDMAQTACRRLSRVLADAMRRKQTVGIYVPGRAVNALAVGKVDTSHCRFFDDDERLHGTYLPGIPIPVESRRHLLESPPDRVVIMSRSFGQRIAAELETALGDAVAVSTWDDVFGISSDR